MDALQPAVQRFKSACTECQRRKQKVCHPLRYILQSSSRGADFYPFSLPFFAIKCNRIFPCSHCSSRSVQWNCRFIEKTSTAASERPRANGAAATAKTLGIEAKGQRTGKKRPRDSSSDSDPVSNSDSDSDTDPGFAIKNGTGLQSNDLGRLVTEQFGRRYTGLASSIKVTTLFDTSDAPVEEMTCLHVVIFFHGRNRLNVDIKANTPYRPRLAQNSRMPWKLFPIGEST